MYRTTNGHYRIMKDNISAVAVCKQNYIYVVGCMRGAELGEDNYNDPIANKVLKNS